MSNQHALKALMTLRAEKAGKILKLEEEAERERIDLIHIDNVIRQVGDGEVDPETIPSRQRFPRRTEHFAHKEITGFIFRVLKEFPEGEAISAAVIVDRVMEIRGFDPKHDRHLRHDWYVRFLVQLRAKSIDGTIEKIGHGKGVTWRLRSTRNAT